MFCVTYRIRCKTVLVATMVFVATFFVSSATSQEIFVSPEQSARGVNPKAAAESEVESDSLIELAAPENASAVCDDCQIDTVVRSHCPNCVCQPSNPCKIRPGDEVWIMSTRHADCQSADELCVHRYVRGIGFVEASTDDYFASSEYCHSNGLAPITTTYVHGNRVDVETASDRGLWIYECLANAAAPDQRLCHVIWSWPSDIIRGMVLVDARAKAYKTHTQSFLLGDFLSRHHQQAQVSLIGFSYGARIILGAQHLIGGGQTFGRRLNLANCKTPPRTRVAAWAPALPAAWITPSGLNGQAMMTVDRMVMYYNTRDPALRFYRKKLAESDTDALGFRGISVSALGQAALRVEQYNAAKLVGAHHSWVKYTSSPEILRRTTACALWQDDDIVIAR